MTDKLPPNDPVAELSVLACVLYDNENAVRRVTTCQERFGADEIFYDVRHQYLWHSIVFLKEKGRPIDIVTLQAELRARNALEQVGGLEYLTKLPDAIPSPEMLPTYVDMVWEKYLARRVVQQSIERAARVMETNGDMTESMIALMAQQHEQMLKFLDRGLPTPKNLKAPSDFAEDFYNVWFKRKQDTYGWQLPFPFPMRIRPSEMTLFTGDNGSGKSSMLGQIAIVCAKQFQEKEKIVIASMEVPPEITLWIMARQLLGVGKLEQNEVNEKRLAAALAWLNRHILLYDFLGITDWRELLHTFEYARDKRNGAIFIVDSVMRIGIPDDDYAMQGIVASRFADFCVKTKAHTFLVVHENKSDARQKDRVRGSKQWTDNAHNVCAMKRNEKKAELLEEWHQELEAETLTQDEYNEKVAKQRKNWDAKFILNKQRWPGSQQNASRWLYFHKESLQFHEESGQNAYDYTK